MTHGTSDLFLIAYKFFLSFFGGNNYRLIFALLYFKRKSTNGEGRGDLGSFDFENFVFFSTSNVEIEREIFFERKRLSAADSIAADEKILYFRKPFLMISKIRGFYFE